MPDHDFNDRLDRLLARTLSADGTASETCVDADVLAAFVDDELRDSERGTVESHLALCGRCREIVAALVRTGEAAATGAIAMDASRARRRFRVPMRWAIPFAGAAAAAALFIAIRPEAPAPTSPAASPGRAVEQTADADQKPKPRSDEESAPQSPAAASAREDRQRRLGKQRGAAPAASERAETGPRPRGTLTRETAEGIIARAPQAAQPSAALQDRPQQRPARNERERPTVMLKRDPPAPVLISPEGASPMWRIDTQQVQRSGDGGATWETVHSVPDVQFAAASCPAGNVCWVVGTGGTVLRMADGSTWQPIPFAAIADLVSVRASDADNAVVTAADGRVFTTRDGGRTWIQ